MVAATVSLLAVWGPWETLVPIVVKNDLGGEASSLGLVFGAGGVGAVIAAAVFGQRGTLPRKPLTAMYLAWALGMFGTAGFGFVTSVWQAMAVAFVTGGVDHVPRRRLGHAGATARPRPAPRTGVRARLDDLDDGGARSRSRSPVPRPKRSATTRR